MLRTKRRWLVLLVMALAGCSSGGPKRYDLSGKVTFDGKDIPAGIIWFDPDLGEKNDGPQGFVEFRNGVYDTRNKGRGPGGGKYIVRIQGYDGREARELPMGRPLFPEYRIKVDLPGEGHTRNFDVPAAKGR
jgi:hypothetical protein